MGQLNFLNNAPASRSKPKRKAQGDSLSEGRALRDDGVQRAEDHAHERWLETMKELVYQVARAKREFNSDDVFALLAAMPDAPETHERRAFGAVMNWAVRNGYCEATGNFKPSTRPNVHMNPIRTWRSKIWTYEHP